MTTAAALALAGCGGSDAPGVATAKSPGSNDAVKSTTSAPKAADEVAEYLESQREWVACLRRHDVNVTDPDGRGQVKFLDRPVKTDPKFSAAQDSCREFLGTVPAEVERLLSPKLTEAEKRIRQRYATCMQTHGAEDFPDPDKDGFTPDVTWKQGTSGARRAASACAPIIGDPVDPGKGVG